MKKRYPTPVLKLWCLLLILSTPLLISSTTKYSLSEQEALELLCASKWHLSYMEVDGEVMEFPANEVAANWTKFNADGTHQVEEMGEAYSGTWSYDHISKTLTTDDRDGKITLKIIEISTTELRFSFVDEGKTLTVGMKP